MFNLVVSYYSSNNVSRQAEIDSCIAHNLSNSILNCIITVSQDRLTFNNYIEIVNKVSSDDDINIIANTDVYFDGTLSMVEKIKKNECYALTRYDVSASGSLKFVGNESSQDCWIFRGKINNLDIPIELGKFGCDNKFAYEIDKAGYNITNPSLDIKCYHLHNSGVRTYIHNDWVPGPYKPVKITRVL